MDLLIIGGTRFVGRHMAELALARGDKVTVLHRGQTGVDLLPEAEHLIADRDADLSVLAHRRWDATIDTCGYIPRQIDTLAAALGDRGGHHAFVSSVSAYAAPDGPGINEDAALVRLSDPTVEVVNAETYGGLKVLCEHRVRHHYGAEALIVRPTYVIGPYDYTYRFPTWIRRIHQGGRVPLPGPFETPLQTIDARDLAAFTLDRVSLGGTFHTVTQEPGASFGSIMEAIARTVAPVGTTLEWIPLQTLQTFGVHDGPLAPLWAGEDSDAWVMAADPSRARTAGMVCRPIEESIADTLEWMQTSNFTPSQSMGMSPELEAQLLAASN